jgi:hypothetical protein
MQRVEHNHARGNRYFIFHQFGTAAFTAADF